MGAAMITKRIIDDPGEVNNPDKMNKEDILKESDADAVKTQNFSGGGVVQNFSGGGFVQESVGKATQLKSDMDNAAPGRDLDPVINLFMNELKGHFGITNTVSGSVPDGAGGFRIQSQEELNEQNNAKLPLGLTMTADGQNIDLGKNIGDQARMVGKLAKEPQYAERLKDIGKQFGFEDMTGEKFQEIANKQGDDLQFNVNRFIPGTESHRLDVAANEINQSTAQNMAGGGLVKNYKQGGFVSGPGGVDKVPAKLTAGEFVMSKGAVQKYGVNTLKSMNAAGGGTNRPTVTAAYNEGGLVQNYNEGGEVTNGDFVFIKADEFGVPKLEKMNELKLSPTQDLKASLVPPPPIDIMMRGIKKLGKMIKGNVPSGSSSKPDMRIPSFNAVSPSRHGAKTKVLGISA